MIELLLILFGTQTVRRRWWVLALAGAAWFALGAFIFANALSDEWRINPVYFSIPLAVDGVFALAAAFGSVGATRGLRFTKAALFLGLAGVIVFTAGRADMVVGIAAGLFLVADACLRTVTAYLVRFEQWRRAIAFAGFELAMGIWLITPWPTHWRGSVGVEVGLLLMLSAANTLSLALRLARLAPGEPISPAVRNGLGGPIVPAVDDAAPGEAPPPAPPQDRETAIVHVWTPTGNLARVDHALSRYIAARDPAGTVSTGHAALELADTYVSHYPAVEIEHSPDDFRRLLRATRDNDVAGRFLPSHAEEVAAWCPPTMDVRVPGMDGRALRRFWHHYSRDTTYNLTSRNCSSTVATALDAGIEGIFAPYANAPYFLFRLALTPELIVAARMRRRAAAMAWTPGLVLDYARALAFIVGLPARLRIEDKKRP